MQFAARSVEGGSDCWQHSGWPDLCRGGLVLPTVDNLCVHLICDSTGGKWGPCGCEHPWVPHLTLSQILGAGWGQHGWRGCVF